MLRTQFKFRLLENRPDRALESTRTFVVSVAKIGIDGGDNFVSNVQGKIVRAAQRLPYAARLDEVFSSRISSYSNARNTWLALPRWPIESEGIIRTCIRTYVCSRTTIALASLNNSDGNDTERIAPIPTRKL